jgi:hypothetical protein
MVISDFVLAGVGPDWTSSYSMFVGYEEKSGEIQNKTYEKAFSILSNTANGSCQAKREAYFHFPLDLNIVIQKGNFFGGDTFVEAKINAEYICSLVGSSFQAMGTNSSTLDRQDGLATAKTLTDSQAQSICAGRSIWRVSEYEINGLSPNESNIFNVKAKYICLN